MKQNNAKPFTMMISIATYTKALRWLKHLPNIKPKKVFAELYFTTYTQLYTKSMCKNVSCTKFIKSL